MDGYLRLADLPPRAAGFYVRLFLGGVLIVGLLLACYAAMPLLNPQTTDGRVATFDLDAEGSLAVYFSSFTLSAAAVACCLTYVLRAGTGRPRGIWLWAACCWMVMGVDECSSLHEAFKEMMSHATGIRPGPEGCFWWVAAYGVVLSSTGVPLLLAMRRSPAACVMFVLVAAFYGVAVLAELGWLMAKDPRGVMVEEGCEMLGNLALLTSMALFARQAATELAAPSDLMLIRRFAEPCAERISGGVAGRAEAPLGV